MLTTNQNALFKFIKAHIAENETAPTYSQMAAGVGLASKSGVHRMLIGLESKGYIRRIPRHKQAIEVLK